VSDDLIRMLQPLYSHLNYPAWGLGIALLEKYLPSMQEAPQKISKFSSLPRSLLLDKHYDLPLLMPAS
jgi:hypothetical protein